MVKSRNAYSPYESVPFILALAKAHRISPTNALKVCIGKYTTFGERNVDEVEKRVQVVRLPHSVDRDRI